ncbi:MAG: AAA family ATPase [Gammaproteobacteria bacterium]|nr:AAA family ATPase [Gammaproteobacteria bacterium]
MYQEHFGLRESPFTITPDTSFYFAHSSHQEALNTLLVAVRSGEGFIKVVGEVGTGKTILCRKFLDALDRESYITAYIPNPYLGPNTLLLAVADELGISYSSQINQHQLLKLLTKFLIDSYAEHRRVVLCLDEAQAMPVETLEAIRLLTNLETERRKLLQVVLFGQPELDVKLDNPAIRQLKQRVTFSCRLRPLDLSDVEFYLAHRLTIAGYRGPRVFAKAAVKRLHRASDGVPRLINILAHKALMAAFGEGVREIGDAHVRLAIADTESIGFRKRLRSRLLRYILGLTPVALLGVAVLVWSSWL